MNSVWTNPNDVEVVQISFSQRQLRYRPDCTPQPCANASRSERNESFGGMTEHQDVGDGVFPSAAKVTISGPMLALQLCEVAVALGFGCGQATSDAEIGVAVTIV